ncbi:immunity protein 26 of polymorphic toxin system [Pseudoduganella lurida]|uniref:Immunity protein 26 of polymorphic toxin system n=1 Tax=Pseudoduganella lurida TaxID=1036180 RepID=A0A562RBY1_9BURK|nr:Imm26 family immunity protein [Pseudoduganella lurida]TWI66562.1 immunity protein 26 of polymorphic toxin system [Pseudoduganella lurida]
MKQPYHEGSWFAVPLINGGFATGLVARMSPQGKIMLAYLFGPKRAAIPSLADVQSLVAGDAVKAIRTGDMALANGRWPVLGDAQDFDRNRWPVPVFIRRSDALKRAWQATYADDPAKPEREVSVPYETEGLESDSLYGYGSTELLLTKLLE